jgi:toxin-antitoxin system PIN domain toxin
VIGLDTNILVYARRSESVFHKAAFRLLRELAEGETAWAIPWPCVYEFLRVVTHPKMYLTPTPLTVALDDVQGLSASPSLHLLGDGPRHVEYLLSMVRGAEARGDRVFDAHIAGILLEHGVREIWTADRDFRRFPGLLVRNPFMDSDEVHEARVRYRPRSPVSSPRRKRPVPTAR